MSRAPAPCHGFKRPCRKTLPGWPGSLCHDTKLGLAIQFPTSLAASVTIQNCIVTHFPSKPAAIHSYLPLLSQYNCCIVTQPTNTPTNFFFLALVSQYSDLLAIYLGSSPVHFLHTIFFFRFAITLNIFLFHLSSHWKTLKKNIYTFFFYFPHSNKFIKIYFLLFSSILQLVKP